MCVSLCVRVCVYILAQQQDASENQGEAWWCCVAAARHLVSSRHRHLVSVDGEPCLRFPDRIKPPSDGSYVRFKRKITGEIKGLTAAARRARIAGEQMRFIRTHDCVAACIYETIRLRSVSDSVASVYTVGTKKRLQLYSVPLYIHWKGGNRGAHKLAVSEFASNYSNSVWWTLQCPSFTSFVCSTFQKPCSRTLLWSQSAPCDVIKGTAHF